MKRFQLMGKVLSPKEQKMIVGGDDTVIGDLPPESGQCCGCWGGPGIYSCWYTTSSCDDVCSRVYPSSPNPVIGRVECSGCVMN